MRRNAKHPLIHFRLDPKLAQKLDRRIARAGYASRSEFFTAVAYATLYGVETENHPQISDKTEGVANLPEHVSSWLQKTMPRISEEEILAGLHMVIEEMLLPVIAMKGVDIAYEHTWEDVRAAYYERFHLWVTESDLREAYASFAMVRKRELAEYREKQLREDGGEED